MVAHPGLPRRRADHGVELLWVETLGYAYGEGFGGGEEDGAGEVVVGYFGDEAGAEGGEVEGFGGGADHGEGGGEAGVGGVGGGGWGVADEEGEVAAFGGGDAALLEL